MAVEVLESRQLLSTLVADPSDVAPNTVVNLFGTGFAAGEAIDLKIVSSNPQPDVLIQVVDGGALDADGKVDGNFDLVWNVGDTNIGATLNATATGETSLSTASVTFTDSSTNPSVDQYQWANKDAAWQNGLVGNTNSSYVEGDAIPYEAILGSLTVGHTYTYTIQFKQTSGTSHAIDYLTSYNYKTDGAPGATVTPPNLGVPTSTIGIPEDSSVTGTITQPDGVFSLYGGSLTGVSGYSTVSNKPDYRQITVTFTASATSATLAWGGHIASQLNAPIGWGAGHGASSIGGAPYHMVVGGITDLADTKHTYGGNQDAQMSADAVTFPTIVTLKKDATPDGAQTFVFDLSSGWLDTSGHPISQVTLVDDGTNDGLNTVQIETFSLVPQTITEEKLAGWVLTNISNSDSTGGSIDLANFKATITGSNGEDDSVTFFDQAQAQPTVVTTASGGGTVGSAVPTDQADLEGGFGTPTGTLTFKLEDALNNVIFSTDDTVSGNGKYDATYVGAVLTPGTYHWVVSYSGDTFNKSAVDQGGADEQVTVDKASPSIATLATGDGSVIGTVFTTDTATVTGGYSPTGTVTFKLVDPNNFVVAEFDDQPIVNGIATSGGYLTSAVGTYTWHATYSGDDLNNGAIDDGTGETLTVDPAQPTLTTVASDDITLGASGNTVITDTADLEGAYSPDGKIVFTLTRDGQTIDAAGQEVAVDHNGTYTVSFDVSAAPLAAGIWQWSAIYLPGNNNNLKAFEPDTDAEKAAESVVVSPATPTLVTDASDDVTLDSSETPVVFTDTADLEGAFAPDGLIVFTLTGPDGSTVLDTETVTVTTNGLYKTPNGYTLPTNGDAVIGTYQWHAVYTPSTGNNLSAEDDGTGESTTVSPAAPTLTSVASQTVFLGAVSLDKATIKPTISDTADLEGAFNADGSIKFTLTFTDAQGSTSDVSDATQTVQVNGNGKYSASFDLPTSGKVAGLYQWHAVYTPGSGNNLDAKDQGGTDEQTLVNPAEPTLVTTASGPVVLDASGNPVVLSDSATFTADYFATGKITFTLTFTDPQGNSKVVYTQDDTVTGNDPYTASYTLPTDGTAVAGTYQWSAVFVGDDNNNKAVDQGGPDEQTTVGIATPSLSTTPNASTVQVGQKMQDTATLTGGFNETGTITFQLFNPLNQVVYTETVKVSGNGTYSTTTGYTPTQSGIYQWVATYTGDGNNSKQAGKLGDEPEIVTAPPKEGTKGLYQNKNGEKFLTGTTTGTAIKADILAGIKAAVKNTDPTYSPFVVGTSYVKWSDLADPKKGYANLCAILNQNASNLADQLSAQMLTTILDTLNPDTGITLSSKVDTALVTTGLNQFMTVQDLIDLAVASLKTNPNTTLASPARTLQGELETVFDAINNAKSIFV